MTRCLTIFTLISAFCTLIVMPPQARAMSGEIAIVVNNDAISMADVYDRMKLIMVSTGLKDTPEIREKLQKQVTTVLVEEQIRLQEAQRLELEITEKEIDEGFAHLASQNKFSPEQFKEIIQKSGVNIDTMRRQINAQIAWTKVIQKELRPRINVRESDIETAMEQLRNKIGKTEYLVAEIFLPVDKPADQSHVRALANKLASELTSGKASFFKMAQQFSQSAGAAKGGDIGWIQEGILDEKIDASLASMSKDKIKGPIKTISGYHIIMLRDKRIISESTMPSEEQMTNSIGLNRLERMQHRHLMDLKANAFIDSRV